MTRVRDCPDCGDTCGGHGAVARYKDLDGTVHMPFAATAPERPQRNMTELPSGFLFCRDVAIARTGEQIYLAREVPHLEPSASGQVVAERHDEDVFHPETIASFNGVPLTDDHPWDDVGPGNYRKHQIGTVLNPRRGTGDRAHCLIADLIVYDASVIRAIREGKREVSCGYDADYVRLGPGRGKQTNIRGNHLSLVDEGRCGPECAIHDHQKVPSTMSKTSVKVNGKDVVSRNRSFVDALRALIKNRDADGDELEKSLEAVGNSMAPGEEPESVSEGGEGDGGDSHHHVTVNIGGLEHHPTTDEDPEGPPPPEEESKGLTAEDLTAALTTALAPIVQRLDALENTLEDVTDPEDTMTQDAVAGALALKPDFAPPTFDAKPGSRAQRDALSGMKKRVLKEAFATRDGAALIGPLVGSARPNFDTMLPGEVDVLFRSAVQRVRDANNASAASAFLPGSTAGYTLDAQGKKRTVDSRALNDIHRAHYKR